MWEAVLDALGALLSPADGRRRWVRVLYVVLAVAAVVAAVVIVATTWPG